MTEHYLPIAAFIKNTKLQDIIFNLQSKQMAIAIALYSHATFCLIITSERTTALSIAFNVAPKMSRLLAAPQTRC